VRLTDQNARQIQGVLCSSGTKLCPERTERPPRVSGVLPQLHLEESPAVACSSLMPPSTRSHLNVPLSQNSSQTCPLHPDPLVTDAKLGSARYLCTKGQIRLLQHRLGSQVLVQGLGTSTGYVQASSPPALPVSHPDCSWRPCNGLSWCCAVADRPRCRPARPCGLRAEPMRLPLDTASTLSPRTRKTHRMLPLPPVVD
jgi:hypothetical protein